MSRSLEAEVKSERWANLLTFFAVVPIVVVALGLWEQGGPLVLPYVALLGVAAVAVIATQTARWFSIKGRHEHGLMRSDEHNRGYIRS